MEPITMSAAETAKYIGISDAKTLDLLERGEIPAVRFGRNWKVVRRQLDAWIEDRAIRETKERRLAYEHRDEDR